jgi:hypothetical protein
VAVGIHAKGVKPCLCLLVFDLKIADGGSDPTSPAVSLASYWRAYPGHYWFLSCKNNETTRCYPDHLSQQEAYLDNGLKQSTRTRLSRTLMCAGNPCRERSGRASGLLSIFTLGLHTSTATSYCVLSLDPTALGVKHPSSTSSVICARLRDQLGTLAIAHLLDPT